MEAKKTTSVSAEALTETEDNVFWDRIAERAEETIDALKNGRTPAVIRFALHITSFCNMRCSYCRETKVCSKMMDRSLFTELCNRVRTNKKGIIHITGGEPLTCPWLEEEIESNKDIKMALNSNLLVRPKDKTITNVFRIKTSLDDYNADRWDKVVGGNYFDRVVENIRYCSDICPNTSVSFTATHLNVDRLPDFIDYCKEKFPNLYSLSVSFVKGGNKNTILTQEDVDKLYISAEKMDTRSKNLFHTTHSTRGNNFPENIQIPCYLSLTERLYDEYGREFYCSHLFRDKVDPPGRPGKDPHCVSGCNARFYKFNKKIHEILGAKQ